MGSLRLLMHTLSEAFPSTETVAEFVGYNRFEFFKTPPKASR